MALTILIAVVALICLIAGLLAIEFHTAVARNEGTLAISGLQAPVEILRDERGIPHIRAQNEHDLFLAQGYAEGSDRLFQMDLTRHFVYGRLAEWFGKPVLGTDEHSRIIDVRGIVDRQWNGMSQKQRAALQAFSDGVNEAMRREPQPFEYWVIFQKPQAWHAQDSLAVGFATVLDLADSYQDVLNRNEVYRAGGKRAYDRRYPLSDPKYDVPIVGTMRHSIVTLRPSKRGENIANSMLRGPQHDTVGKVNHENSNEWAVGSAHSLTGHALLANDPHLDLSIPGIWYLVDLQAPGFHAAGASLAGTPGVILGHNDKIAWGATNGTVAALSVFSVNGGPPKSSTVQEHFGVRFAPDQRVNFYRDAHGFFVSDRAQNTFYVAWSAYSIAVSPLDAFDGLDRATSVDDGLKALSRYPGPTQNFVLAGTDGRAAYTLAGWIPKDPFWGERVHDGPPRAYPILPFGTLPHVAPSKSAIVFTANNRMYGEQYPYRLSATFAPPYRAYEIARLLRSRKKYDVAYFAQMQNDNYSVAEKELADIVAAAASRNPGTISRTSANGLFSRLRSWDGHYSPESRAASVAYAVRLSEVRNAGTSFPALLESLRGHRGKQADTDRELLLAAFDWTAMTPATLGHLQRPWIQAGATPMLNPLNNFGITWMNGPSLPGNGDAYTIHAQTRNFNQSFRAVWDVGNWDGGGIVIPAGESGEPGSPHYQDLTATYIAGRLEPLPFSEAAVRRHTVNHLKLTPL